ncbi:MAG: hypothetical protein ACK5OO_03085 [Cyclobacteriaceae bacterium]|jgi:hypothetical protein
MSGSGFLKWAGAFSLGIALLHIAIGFVGPTAYRYFGAGEEMATLAEQGSWQPFILTLFIALVLFVFGFYAWSGAGAFRKLPLLRWALVIIAGIYVLRGLGLFVQLLGVLKEETRNQDLTFSGISLVIGLCYVAGIRLNWNRL